MTDTQQTSKKNNNALFNPKFIKKVIATAGILKNGEIPEKAKKIIERRLSNQAILDILPPLKHIGIYTTSPKSDKK